MAKNDEKIKVLLKKVEEKRSELGSKPKGVLVTNGIFQINEKDHVNINTVNDVLVFVSLMKVLLSGSYFNNLAASVLEVPLDEKSFTFSGFTVDEWKQDFKLKISCIEWEKKKKELDNLQKKLDTLVSEEMRTEFELENIENFLK